jgi:hypothetical protein
VPSPWNLSSADWERVLQQDLQPAHLARLLAEGRDVPWTPVVVEAAVGLPCDTLRKPHQEDRR